MGKGKAKRGIPSKSEEFNAWYPFIVEAADLVDKRYPIKGMDVWRPYGWKAMKLIDRLTHRQMEITDHEEVNFPLLIPENLLEKENLLVARLKKAREENIDPDELRLEEEEAGFKKEVYWVKHAGENDLDIPMFLRPTSETAMYTMFPLWIRSHADLPLKIYQMVNTFRYETKQTRSFIRVREIHFFEAHTAHASEEDATKQIEQDLDIVDKIMHDLCIPVIKAKRPTWDTFPGAWYTIGIDAVMPNGRTLQVASCHHYRDQWAKAFDIKFETESEGHKFCHQTTYGMSERLLGAVVGVHGDDDGLIMPPAIAPIQVVMIPIRAENNPAVMIAIQNMKKQLEEAGIRCKIDDRDIRPGSKYYDWEIKGVPLRIELGPRDLESKAAMMAPRIGEKQSFLIDDTVEFIQNSLTNIASQLRKNSQNHFNSILRPMPAFTIEDGRLNTDELIEEGYIYEMPFSGTDAHAEIMEKNTGLGFLGEATTPYAEQKVCPFTHQKTTKRVLLSRSY